MKVLKTINEVKQWRESIAPEKNIGFVPTMGALHSGHESLLKASRKENDLTVLSIFVNPTQFNNPDDLKNYPNTMEKDLFMAEQNGVDAVFAPDDMRELYPDFYRFRISESEFSKTLCGAHRPGHFDGVLTVVMKLFHLIQPKRAYFGEKDHQQLTLIRDMVSSFFLPVDVIACPTIRETSGLAMSSRNMRLSPDELEVASKLFETITQVKNKEQAIQKLHELGFKVDYLEDRTHIQNEQPRMRRYVAATLGKVRLIDNVEI
jgi:pantoate--beta-alanine ligase